MRSHKGMKADRATARRQLQSLRGSTRIDVRHELVTDDLIEQHLTYHDVEDDE